MSIAEKFEVIADAVYEKGLSNAELEFWKSFTNNGARTGYYYSFADTDFSGKTIPKGLCKPKSRLSNMFFNYKGTTLPLGIDCSEFNTNADAAYHASQMFRASPNLTEIYDMGIPVQKTYANAFQSCTKLTKIAVIRCDENTVWTNAFSDIYSSLKELTIEGKIGQNGFNVLTCTGLTHDSLMSIINATATITSAQTLTLGSANLAKLTDAEKAIAIDRGWTLA